jgi:hypothetical protein
MPSFQSRLTQVPQVSYPDDAVPVFLEEIVAVIISDVVGRYAWEGCLSHHLNRSMTNLPVYPGISDYYFRIRSICEDIKHMIKEQLGNVHVSVAPFFNQGNISRIATVSIQVSHFEDHPSIVQLMSLDAQQVYNSRRTGLNSPIYECIDL